MRYIAFGLFTNVMFYCIYLFITWLGLEPKIAMTVVSIVGGLQSYYLNKNMIFKYEGLNGTALPRYCSAYVLIYVLNFLGLMVFVDHMLYPHQTVQAVILIFLALLMFSLQKLWIFTAKKC